jgi:hypothetical protein
VLTVVKHTMAALELALVLARVLVLVLPKDSAQTGTVPASTITARLQRSDPTKKEQMSDSAHYNGWCSRLKPHAQHALHVMG